MPPDSPLPPLPRNTNHPSLSQTHPPPAVTSKRKTTGEDEDVEMEAVEEDAKRAKTVFSLSANTIDTASDADTARRHAQMAASHIDFLDTEHLLPPSLPTHQEMENVLLNLRKKALVEEYFGDGQP